MASTSFATAGIDIPGITLLGELGRGAHSIVYAGERDGRALAVKVSQDSGTPSIRRQFLREAALLASLRHPSFAEIFEIGERSSRAYLVMERVDGQTLAVQFEHGRFDTERVRALALDVAEGLAAIHRRGLVHRDVKPRNIVVDNDQRARLIDFGLVTRSGDGLDAELGGTFLYSAPEQTGLLKRPIDGRADLYALGVVLYEAVAGRPPFRASDAGELMRQHAVVEPPALTHLVPNCHPVLALIIHRLLAKDPDDRYQTAEGLALDLVRLTELEGTLAEGAELVLGRDDFQYGVLRETPLIGREPEIRALKHHWEDTQRGRGTTVLIHGRNGAGKTRLMSELMSYVRETGGLPIEARGRASSTEPLSAIHGAINSLMDQLDRLQAQPRSELVSLIREAGHGFEAILTRSLPRLRTVLAPAQESEFSVKRSEHYHEAFASFVLGFARASGGTALFVDDAESLDEASLRVIERIAARIVNTPALMVVACRSDGRAEKQLPGLRAVLGPKHVSDVEVTPLGYDSTERLLCSYLGVTSVGADLVQQMMVRTEGSPMLMTEYVRSMLEAGMLVPNWGEWIIDRKKLADIQLSQNVLQLVRQRIELLDPEARTVLGAASILGIQFDPDILTGIAGVDEETVNWAIAKGLRARLLERESGGNYSFIHRQVWEGFAEDLAPAAERDLHRAAAVALRDRYGAEDPAVVYSLARHEALGGGDRIYESNLRAGLAALEAYSYEGAHGFLSCAHQAQPGRAKEDFELQRALGLAAGRTGRTLESVEMLTRAVEMTHEPTARAELHGMLAQVHIWDSFRTGLAWDEVGRGLAVIGDRISRSKLGRIGRALLQWVLGQFIGLTRLGYGAARGDLRRRLSVQCQLLKMAGHVRYWTMKPDEMVLLLLRMLYPANRIGPGPEVVYTHTGYTLALAAVGLKSFSRRSGKKAVASARELNDRALEGYSRMNSAIAMNVRGEVLASEQEMKESLAQLGGFLDHGEYTQGIADLSWQLQLRGYPAEALRWVDRGLAAEKRAEFQRGQIFLQTRAAICHVTCGSSQTAREHLTYAKEIADAAPKDLYRRGNYFSHLAFFYYELNQIEECIAALEEYERLGIPTERSPFHMRNTYVFAAYARAEEAEAGNGNPDHLDEALAQLKLVCKHNHPLLSGHYAVALARRHYVAQDYSHAHTSLDRALRLAFAVDAPWLEFEVKYRRALVVKAEGHASSADRLAREAHEHAVVSGWITRARRLRRDFPQVARSTLTRSTHGDSATDNEHVEAGNPRTVQLQRHVDALVQVSQVSLSVIDSSQQARAILDEIVSLFGAERAFLFLEGEAEEVELFAARNSMRGNLRERRGYSTTVIERVLSTRKPVVLSGKEDAVALGSESAVVLNLRSIIAAPLLIRDRLVGVVYLDNRLAKGIFTELDAQTLTAISSHIAIAIETSRTAQLELEYKTERDKRRLAEALRALTSQSAALSHDSQIVDRLLESVFRFVPATRADCYVLRGLEWKWVASKVDGFKTRLLEGGEGAPVRTTDYLSRIRHTREPHLLRLTAETDRDAIPNLGLHASTWLAVPLLGANKVQAVLTMESDQVNGLDDGCLELAQTFANQAGIAIDNVRLFNQVQQLATVDELTGVSNRRAVFDFARTEFRRSLRYEQPMALIMLDVDHFKPVNDTHGHSVGDVVLKEIAKRCGECARDVDQLGRYGGEEFIMVAPFTSADSAVKLAERMREMVEGEPIETTAGPLRLTISLGVAEIRTNDTSVDEILERADAALYEAKHGGRNQVRLAEA